jgi:hypothetical protein
MHGYEVGDLLNKFDILQTKPLECLNTELKRLFDPDKDGKIMNYAAFTNLSCAMMQVATNIHGDDLSREDAARECMLFFDKAIRQENITDKRENV